MITKFFEKYAFKRFVKGLYNALHDLIKNDADLSIFCGFCDVAVVQPSRAFPPERIFEAFDRQRQILSIVISDVVNIPRHKVIKLSDEIIDSLGEINGHSVGHFPDKLHSAIYNLRNIQDSEESYHTSRKLFQEAKAYMQKNTSNGSRGQTP